MRLGVRLVILVLVAALGVSGGLGPPLTDAKKPKKAKTVTRTFSDNGQLEIPDFVDKSAVGPAKPFPTTIVVNGFKKAKIRDVNLTLRTYTHGWPADVDVLLVAPNGPTRWS